MDFKTERITNFIIFSHIKEFVEDLSSVYEDEPLITYKNFINSANILTDTKDFVVGFKPCIGGLHRAKYCDGAYINVPKFLKKKDDNYEIIKTYLEKFNKLYVDPVGECKEIGFMMEYSSNIDGSDFAPPEENPNQEYFMNILTKLKPDIQKTQADFKSRNLNSDRFLKIFLICAYDKTDSVPNLGEDAVHIKNLINIIANTPITYLGSKKLELMKEFMSIKNLSGIPYQSFMSGVQM